MAATADVKLFESYLAPVLKTAYGTALYLTQSGACAQRLVQDASVRAYRRFMEREPGDSFKVWFLRILNGLYQNPVEEKAQALSEWEADVDARLARSGFVAVGGGFGSLATLPQETLIGAFAMLPVEYRVVCALYFLDEWTYQDIADILGCTLEMARTRLHRGRRWIQFLLLASAQNGASLHSGGPASYNEAGSASRFRVASC